MKRAGGNRRKLANQRVPKIHGRGANVNQDVGAALHDGRCDLADMQNIRRTEFREYHRSHLHLPLFSTGLTAHCQPG